MARAPPGVDPLAFLAIPLGDMAVFSALICSGALSSPQKGGAQAPDAAGVCCDSCGGRGLLPRRAAAWPDLVLRADLPSDLGVLHHVRPGDATARASSILVGRCSANPVRASSADDFEYTNLAPAGRDVCGEVADSY